MPRKKRSKPRQPPLSLYGLTVDQVVGKLLKAAPKRKTAKKKSRKRK